MGIFNNLAMAFFGKCCLGVLATMAVAVATGLEVVGLDAQGTSVAMFPGVAEGDGTVHVPASALPVTHRVVGDLLRRCSASLAARKILARE